MPEIVGVRLHDAYKVRVLYHFKNQTFRDWSQPALSIERDGDPLEYVKVLSSTLVKLYLASIPLLRVSL